MVRCEIVFVEGIVIWRLLVVMSESDVDVVSQMKNVDKMVGLKNFYAGSRNYIPQWSICTISLSVPLAVVLLQW